nr:DNA recombination/repair protein RecA [Wolbachia endosymbiont of Dirofilaria (Dirofilaria) immitis]
MDAEHALDIMYTCKLEVNTDGLVVSSQILVNKLCILLSI